MAVRILALALVVTLTGAVAAEPLAPKITVRPGFRVENLYSVPLATQGSWVSITRDDKGRLIASAQHRKGLFRITPAPIGQPATATRVEALAVDVGQAHGLVQAFGSLYVVTSEAKERNGVYRVRDTNGDDQYDEVTRLFSLEGNGEHGPHGITAGPDGKSLYVIGGNGAPIPKLIDRSRVTPGWGDDHLVPPLQDPSGNKKSSQPGGWVIKFDPEGKSIEVVSSGLRNSYDIAFNDQGELFTYDSDMEWDLGTFWYRPPRVCHIPSGADFGWRISTRPWPAYWADSVPPVIETGPASPTGVVFGYGARFPAKYQRALFALDWTYGAIYAVHLSARGGTYDGTLENFVSGSPLPVTDAVVGADGGLYFITGGRTLVTTLFRVTYDGPESTAPIPAAVPTKLVTERRRLEAFHGIKASAAVGLAVPQLGHEDRFLRHAARVALEHQPAATWQSRIFGNKDPKAQITGAIALARVGKADFRPQLLALLGRIPIAPLPTEFKLDLLRAYSLIITRLGAPTDPERIKILRQLEPIFPANDERLDAELARVLSYLKSAVLVPKTVELMANARADSAKGLVEIAARNDFYGAAVKDMAAKSPLRQRMFFAAMLRSLTVGWTPELRSRYFRLINDAMANSRGGNVYYSGWQAIRDEAESLLPDDERKRLAGILGATPTPNTDLPAAVGPGKIWSVNAIMEALDGQPTLMTKRDLANGKKMFSAAACVLCHRFGSEGGAVGPDLNGLSGRFGLRDLVASIVTPSAVVSDQYQSQTVTKKDGSTIGGRLVSQDQHQLVLMPNMFSPQALTTVDRKDVTSIEISPVSQMPAVLLNTLNRDEVFDLLAYLLKAR